MADDDGEGDGWAEAAGDGGEVGVAEGGRLDADEELAAGGGGDGEVLDLEGLIDLRAGDKRVLLLLLCRGRLTSTHTAAFIVRVIVTIITLVSVSCEQTCIRVERDDNDLAFYPPRLSWPHDQQPMCNSNRGAMLRMGRHYPALSHVRPLPSEERARSSGIGSWRGDAGMGQVGPMVMRRAPVTVLSSGEGQVLFPVNIGLLEYYGTGFVGQKF